MSEEGYSENTVQVPAAACTNVEGTCSQIGTDLTQRDSRPVRLGYVYFVRAGDAIKIGFSTNSKTRLASLQTSNSEQLELLAMMRGTQSDERDLHQQFCHLNLRGEWFRVDEELLDFIRGCQPRPPRPPASPKTIATIKMLAAERHRAGPDTPLGHRYSNLIEQIRNYEHAEGNKEFLAGAIAKSMADIKTLRQPAA